MTAPPSRPRSTSPRSLPRAPGVRAGQRAHDLKTNATGGYPVAVSEATTNRRIPMNTSDILNKAADLIEERGWTWGTGWPDPEREGQKLCLEGGIMAAVGLKFDEAEADFWFCPAYRAVQAHLDRPEYLFEWNDRADRTQAEVIEVLRATAVIEAARETQPAEVPA